MKEFEFKGTPGPWEIRRAKFPVDGEFDWAIGADVNDAKVCIAESYGRGAELVILPAEANARLIAAAPELFDALKGLLEITKREMSDRPAPAVWDAIEDSERALSRAIGEQ